MAEIDKNKLKEIKEGVGFDEPGEHRRKEVKIIVDKKHYTIRIPKEFAEFMKITKEDSFLFHLMPYEEELGKFELTGELIKR